MQKNLNVNQGGRTLQMRTENGGIGREKNIKTFFFIPSWSVGSESISLTFFNITSSYLKRNVEDGMRFF